MYRKILYITAGLLAPLFASAQSADDSRYAVKAHAQIGLGDAMSMKSSMPGLTGKTSTDEYGVDFGWRVWQKDRHSLEVNVGVCYSGVSTDLSLPELKYSYAAPAVADMDGETYTRYTELSDFGQKCNVSRLAVPVYLSYGYRCTDWVTVHADLGFNFGFKTSAKLSDLRGEAYSYGIYPQYDNLMIDATYMNGFGRRGIAGDATAPEVSAMTVSLLAGIGAEFRVYGPLALDLSLRYNGGLTNLYKQVITHSDGFTETNSPLTYTVKDGERIKSLTDYVTASKLSQLSVNISLIYRF